MSESMRARLNLLVATALAFAFGLGLASALDLTPLSIAADDRPAPTLVLGAPGSTDVTMNGGFADMLEQVKPAVVTVWAYGERRTRRVAQLPPDLELPDDFEFPEGFEVPPGSEDPAEEGDAEEDPPSPQQPATPDPEADQRLDPFDSGEAL